MPEAARTLVSSASPSALDGDVSPLRAAFVLLAVGVVGLSVRALLVLACGLLAFAAYTLAQAAW